MTGPRRALVVIAKEPVAGAVKTRLAATLGDDGAGRAAAAMLADTVAGMAEVDAEPWVCFAPPEAGGRMARLAPGFGLLAQVEGDLGDRLAGCFAALLGGGADQVVIVAADTPQVPRTTYEAAFALLDQVDVVLVLHRAVARQAEPPVREPVRQQVLDPPAAVPAGQPHRFGRPARRHPPDLGAAQAQLGGPQVVDPAVRQPRGDEQRAVGRVEALARRLARGAARPPPAPGDGR